jgi:hypothetical protein
VLEGFDLNGFIPDSTDDDGNNDSDGFDEPHLEAAPTPPVLPSTMPTTSAQPAQKPGQKRRAARQRTPTHQNVLDR